MDWPVAVSLALGGSGWLTLFVRERARESAKEQFGELIGAKLAEFESSLIAKLNGTYRRRAECELMMEPMEKRVTALEREQQELHEYAHETKHSLANSMHKLYAESHASRTC